MLRPVERIVKFGAEYRGDPVLPKQFAERALDLCPLVLERGGFRRNSLLLAYALCSLFLGLRPLDGIPLSRDFVVKVIAELFSAVLHGALNVVLKALLLRHEFLTALRLLHTELLLLLPKLCLLDDRQARFLKELAVIHTRLFHPKLLSERRIAFVPRFRYDRRTANTQLADAEVNSCFVSPENVSGTPK